jgi:hypothetical protein
VAYFPANLVWNRSLVQKNMDATTNIIDPDHNLEAVEKQQWFSTAGVWTEDDDS